MWRGEEGGRGALRASRGPLHVDYRASPFAFYIRKKGESNPFVVGATEYQMFLEVMEGCTRVNLARRKL